MQKLKITGQEAKEHLIIYKRTSALYSVKTILEKTPERVEKFGLSLNDFSELVSDLEETEKKYKDWCFAMSEKYDIKFDQKLEYNIDYVDKLIFLKV